MMVSLEICREPVLSGAVDSTAASTAANATRASPPAELATRSSTSSEITGWSFANPFTESASARSRISFTSSAVSGSSRRTRQQCTGNFERRILGCCSDQGYRSVFNGRQQSILLPFVEAMNLIDEEDSAHAKLSLAFRVSDGGA